jgi:thiamine pyrophosphokinase
VNVHNFCILYYADINEKDGKGLVMRGVAFIGGEGPGPERAALLAEGADLIVAADSGLMAAENAGLTPDWLLGDWDSLDSVSRLEKYQPEKILRFERDKDFTDTELAFDFLRSRLCDDIWLVGGGGGRMDHLFGIRSLFERKAAPSRWVTDAEDVYCLEEGSELRLQSAREGIISTFPLGDGPWEAGSEGLKWPLSGLPWNRGYISLSNVAISGTFSIKAGKGRFMVIIENFQS